MARLIRLIRSTMTRKDRPDVHAYTVHATHALCGPCVIDLWWDDQEGVVPGWCYVIYDTEGACIGANPFAGRENSSEATILRNLARELA